MPAIKSVRYIEVFLEEFDHDSAGSLKNSPLLPGVLYIVCPLQTGLTVTTTTATNYVKSSQYQSQLFPSHSISFQLVSSHSSWLQLVLARSTLFQVAQACSSLFFVLVCAFCFLIFECTTPTLFLGFLFLFSVEFVLFSNMILIDSIILQCKQSFTQQSFYKKKKNQSGLNCNESKIWCFLQLYHCSLTEKKSMATGMWELFYGGFASIPSRCMLSYNIIGYDTFMTSKL